MSFEINPDNRVSGDVLVSTGSGPKNITVISCITRDRTSYYQINFDKRCNYSHYRTYDQSYLINWKYLKKINPANIAIYYLVNAIKDNRNLTKAIYQTKEFLDDH